MYREPGDYCSDRFPLNLKVLKSPEMIRIMRESGIKYHSLVGLLVELWSWFYMYTTDGKTFLDDPKSLLSACGVPEEWYGIIPALISVNWLRVTETGIEIPNWDDVVRSGTTGRRCKSGYVYFISNGTYTKIGRATKPEERLKQLATSQSHGELELLRTIWCRNAVSVEHELHCVFKSKRVRGEWFLLSREEVAGVSIGPRS